MPDVRPFRAHRYDLGRVGALADVLALPGEVPRGPYHAAHLFHDPGMLRDWLREDVLVQDSARSLYVVHQELDWNGERLVRKGVLALVGEGPSVLPAVGLYPDDHAEVIATLERAIGRRPPLEARDSGGTLHRLWAVSDQHAVSEAVGLLSAQPVMILEGEPGLTVLVSMSDPGLALSAGEGEPPSLEELLELASNGQRPAGVRAVPATPAGLVFEVRRVG